MKWLERYILLERVFVDLEEDGEFDIADRLQGGVEKVWSRLGEVDREYLTGRGAINTVQDLDEVTLPESMTWGTKHQHGQLGWDSWLGNDNKQFLETSAIFQGLHWWRYSRKTMQVEQKSLAEEFLNRLGSHVVIGQESNSSVFGKYIVSWNPENDLPKVGLSPVSPNLPQDALDYKEQLVNFR